MKTTPLCLLAAAFVLGGCTGLVPYRSADLDEDVACRAIYAGRDTPDRKISSPEAERCWRRSVEERDNYDLLFAEFTDQGWVQGSSDLTRPARDYIDRFLGKLRAVHAKWRAHEDYEGLSLVVFVHGWHHNAQADDPDVIGFRRFLADMAGLEQVLAGGGKPRRVVGIFVGWRGESVDVPLARAVTFWERKNTAERVALGTVRELLLQLDHFRDRSRGRDNERDVRMLTIGHSFGGLIAYTAMGPEFLRSAVRFKEHRPGSQLDRFMSRVGDLVVIVNPAFEGARYEPLHTAGQRLCGVEPNQLPVLVLATSRGDGATGVAFPLARQFSTLFERANDDKPEDDAIVKAVGHNVRYITHELSLCAPDDQACRSACAALPAATQKSVGSLGRNEISIEYDYMQQFARDGFGMSTHLCGGLDLEATRQWVPRGNPFWVVRTSEEVIKDHGDIFNRNFIAFVRQLYLAFVYARHHLPDDRAERNPCPESR